MNKNNYNNDIYKMYEEEAVRLEQANKTIKNLRLEIHTLKLDLASTKNKINKSVEMAKSSLLEENSKLKNELNNAYSEISRLKSQIAEQKNKDYKIDKLTNQVNKNSTNSGIPTSKEMSCNKPKKTGANTYNHRKNNSKKNGGQYGHEGRTLTKEKLFAKIKNDSIPVKQVIHFINGNPKEEDIIKYTVGIKTNLYVEEHIFKHTPKSIEVLPKRYYSDVTYSDELKSLVVTLGNYYCLGYSKVKEILYDFSNGVINISEGTIDNIYDEFSDKSEETINNITTNILNETYQHTDETTTSENGRVTYYRGYGNQQNILYKYHYKKGDAPIEEDNILTKYFGTIISDHEVGIFKYGTNNQDCIIHAGRYCIEGEQNVLETEWQMDFYKFLLKLDRERKILLKFGRNKFTQEEIYLIEKEYDEILELGENQNKEILSSYWREKEEKLLKRFKNNKPTLLFFIHDFNIPCENNFMERCLRMIKGKTKVSGGFRSRKGGIRFGNIMSIIKTAKLRKLNPFNCIQEIFQGKSLFA